MNTQVRHIKDFMHQWAPPGIKMSYDNVGLLVGDPSASVSRVLVCLDVTEEVVNEAVDKKCELIVSHHPLIFKDISRINPTNEQGRIIYKLIRNNIALMTAHTNLDAALDGVSFVLANNVGLDNLQFLDKNYNISRKISLVTNTDDTQAVLKLLNYFSAEEAHYYSVDNRKEGQYCFEATIDEQNVGQLRAALEKEGLLKKGSFQEMELTTPSNNFGMGVIGDYPEEGIAMDEFLHLVCRALDVPSVRFSGSSQRIKKVAVCGGAGVFLKNKALKAGADAFVTADIKYHDYFTERDDFLLVDAGHYESEFPVVEAIRKELTEAFEHLFVDATEVVTNPMKIYVTDFENKNI
ncbi:Nif3-like dinuclear metal center hexameric protein [Rhodohalobacter halophilus]|uniref:Nif3-like dinuclear metal center hexameric protein n=1 Tax=Rhodohalobacter halophilus TaxID=1812810 RepID=UPI00083F990F|nr:Nif3-like dinuclear metal center hexameric protein [Rhodohalobacter halophilus]